MLINGKVSSQSYQENLRHLASLNSSFPQYLGTKLQYQPSHNIVQLYNQGHQFLKQGNYSLALNQFQAIENQIPKNHPNNCFLGQIYSDISSVQQAQGNYKDAATNCQKSINEFQNSKNHYSAEASYQKLANINKANGTLANYEKESQNLLNDSLKNNDQTKELEARLALGGINRVQGNHEEAMQHYAKSYDLQQGKIDYNAVRVEQHEVGFSDQKIGTDNIQQCVAVILHDPVTKKTALAHVDRFTDTKSLSNVISNFPPDTKLNAYLVGGRDRSQQGKAVSDDNIYRVLSELNNHKGVDIKSADIGDKGAPSGIVFDPQTAELKHAVPGKQHETTNERKLLHNLTPSLNFAFDLTKSPEIKGPTLTPQDKEVLVQRYLSTPKMNTQNEAWNANVMYEPLAKTTEKILKENPKIFESAVEKHLNGPFGSRLNVEQKRMVMNDVKQSLSDSNNSLNKVEQIIEKQVKGSNLAPDLPKIVENKVVNENKVKAPEVITNKTNIQPSPAPKKNIFDKIVDAVTTTINDKVVNPIKEMIEKVKGVINDIIDKLPSFKKPVQKVEAKVPPPSLPPQQNKEKITSLPEKNGMSETVTKGQEQSKNQNVNVSKGSKPPPLPPKPKGLNETVKKMQEHLKNQNVNVSKGSKPPPLPPKPKEKNTDMSI